jgi:putative membrane protein insertion efficiency factor
MSTASGTMTVSARSSGAPSNAQAWRRRGARFFWVAGSPLRLGLVSLVRLYRLTLSGAFGGPCRFYPSCSAYAEEAIGRLGVVRGVGLTVWRILRCSPLTAGGVDYPPKSRMYDSNIQTSTLDSA